MSEENKPQEPVVAEQPAPKMGLDDLIKQKKEAAKVERAQKKAEEKASKADKVKANPTQKPAPKKQGPTATITITPPHAFKSDVVVVIKGLPKTTAADVQQLIFSSVGTRNVPVVDFGYTWNATFRNERKAEELIANLNGGECKESGRKLVLYLKDRR